MKNFGPFDTYADALKAACPLILSKPHAAVGHLLETAPDLARRTATEYCAWLYYTPEHKYEMSMLTDQSRMDDVVTGRRSCVLPAFVEDSRYAAGELKYVFALHNHPFGHALSAGDARFIERMASLHDWEVTAKDERILLSIIAFFSKSKDPAAPTCDGFYQFTPATNNLVLWTQTQGSWENKRLDPSIHLKDR
jgi:hypothetical protein